jgi:hypothetical protein
LYSSSALVWVSDWGEERRVGHVERTEKTHACVRWENLKKSSYCEKEGVDVTGLELEDVDCINLAYVWKNCWFLLNTFMILQIP